MGLDTYAQPSPDEELSAEDEQAFEQAGISLCGGLLSGNDGSFRGKVYDDLVYEVTGQSLYQEWIPPEVVAAMYQKLRSCNLSDHPDREDDIKNLRRFFKVCMDRSLGLHGWW